MKFFITDVFGESRYSGNQLATVLEFGQITDEEMQRIAREINFSETTFITSQEKVGQGYNVRIFTPSSELEFAGHPTLGTAYILDKYFEKGKADKILLNLKVGQIPVTMHEGYYWMKHKIPQFGKTLSGKTTADMLSLSESDLDADFNVEEVSTGLPVLIVPLRNMEALKKAKINKIVYEKYVETEWAKGILVFCTASYSPEQDIAARVFVDYFGIPEDPATGSAMGCLGAYVLKNNYLNSDNINICVGQGYEIGRPSSLYIKASFEAESYDINVGGNVVEIASGEWG